MARPKGFLNVLERNWDSKEQSLGSQTDAFGSQAKVFKHYPKVEILII